MIFHNIKMNLKMIKLIIKNTIKILKWIYKIDILPKMTLY